MLSDWSGSCDPLPDSLKNCSLWLYGVGNYSSEIRKGIGSVVFSATAYNGTRFNIRHHILDGSSQWVIESNVTKSCNILLICKNVLKLPLMELYRCPKRHQLLHSVFCDASKLSIQSQRSAMFCATAQVQSLNAPRKLGPITKNIIDKEDNHVCGHSNYIKIILQRGS